MADLAITSVDLSEGLKTKYLVVPEMKASVVIPNASSDMLKAVKEDKLIVQLMADAAFDKLAAARKSVHEAIKDIDKGYEKNPPADKKEAEERAATLTAMCKKVAEAQGSAATAAAEAEWDKRVKKNKDLLKFRVVFSLKMALGTISVTASVISAVMSMGTLAITIVGAAKTLVGMAAEIYNFARGMESVEKDIIETDLVLAKRWEDPDATAGKVGKELAAVLGVPFTKGITTLEKLLDEYNAKNAKKDKLAEEMYDQAKKLLKAIAEAPDLIAKETADGLTKLQTEVTELLDGITNVVKASKSNDQFYAAYLARCTTYADLEGKKLKGTMDATGVALLLAGVAATAKSVAEIAVKLA